MWKKSLSEKIARVFEIVGYVLLIPAIPLVVLSAVFIFPLLISLPAFGIGLTLLVGYVKHSRGTLDEGKILPLWMVPFLYNVLPLMFIGFRFYGAHQNKIGLDDFNIFSLLLVFWLIAAVCLSLTAIYDEIKFGD